MADNSNYIGVAMGLDVTDLKSGLAEASKQISKANADFKAAASGMDDWTKSTEGLQAKVKQLDTVLGAQKSKLAGLKAEYEKVAAEQGENSDAAQKLYIRMQNQQAIVNKTQKEFDNFSEVLKQAEAETLDLEKATIKANGELKEMGDGAKDAGDKMKGGFGGTVAKGIVGGIAAIGAAAIAAVGSFLSLAESTRETRENMNKLTAGFTTAGLKAEDATKTYTELYKVLGDEGQATEAAAHLAQLANSQEDLSKWTNIATGVYATFGDSLPIEGLTEAANETAKTGQITGNLADALNWAGVSEDEFQAKLDAASTEQERQALITETLNGLYSEQASTFKELNGDIMASREADAALSQTLAELGAIAEPIMTTLKVLAADLLKSITPFVALIGNGLKGALEGTAGATDMLAEGLGGILNVLVTRITEMLPTILNIILQLIPSIADTLLAALPQLLDVVIELVTQIINLLSTLLPQILIKIVELVPLLIEQIIAAVPQLLQAAITLLMAIVQALPTIITSLISALPSLINTIINALLTAIPMLIQAAIQLFMAIIRALPTIIQALVTNLPMIINTIINGLITAIPLLLQAAIDLLMAIIAAIPQLLPVIVRELPKITLTITKTLLSRLPDLIKAAFELFMGIVKAIPQVIVELARNVPDIIKTIVSGLKDGIADIKTIGGDIIRGLWEGIKDMSGWIGKKIKGFGEDVLGGLKSFFGIKSPSKLVEDEVGQYVGQAVGTGAIKSLPNVKKQLSKFVRYVADNLGNIKAGLSLDGVVSGGNGGSTSGNRGGSQTVVNAGMTVHYNGNLSRKQLKRLENDQYRAIKTKLIAEGAI